MSWWVSGSDIHTQTAKPQLHDVQVRREISYYIIIVLVLVVLVLGWKSSLLVVFYLAILCCCKYTTIKTILLKANTFLFLCLCVMFILHKLLFLWDLGVVGKPPLHYVCAEWDWALIGTTWKILGTLNCIPYGQKISRCFLLSLFRGNTKIRIIEGFVCIKEPHLNYWVIEFFILTE